MCYLMTTFRCPSDILIMSWIGMQDPTNSVSRMRSSFGDRTFAAAGPQVWNSLLPNLTLCGLSYGQFRWLLKTFSFGQWGHTQCEPFLTAPNQNIVTYLLTYLLKWCTTTSALHYGLFYSETRYARWMLLSDIRCLHFSRPRPINMVLSYHTVWPMMLGCVDWRSVSFPRWLYCW